MKLFLPLTKVDVEKREVWGRATHEVADKSGEIFDYATSKPLFEKWSSDFEKATDGKSKGNVRAMHGKVAAGKVISIDYNDAEKAIDIGTKIVDDAEWAKVVEGVYTGFSIGGSYTKRWKDGDLQRFTANPAEISIVDNPCVSTAVFAMVKADGSVEEKSFKNPIEQVWRCGPPDCFHAAKADAATCRAEAVAKAAAADADATSADEPIIETATETALKAAGAPIVVPGSAIVTDLPAGDVEKVIAPPALEVIPPAVKKSLYDVSSFAVALLGLATVANNAEWEAQYEGDSSDIPARLRAWIGAGAPILVDMASEEASEVVAQLSALAQANGGAAVAVLEDAAADELGKAGARNSKADQSKVQGIHDSAMALGANCPAPEKVDVGDLAKLATDLAVEKAALAKSIEDLTIEKGALVERVKTLEALPATPKAALKAVDKFADREPTPSVLADLDAQIEKARTPDEKAFLEIKKVLRSGGTPLMQFAR